MNGAVSDILVRMAWRSVTLDVHQNRLRLLNSVAKFVHCVQTLESCLDKAEIAANFGLQKRCGLSLF